MKSALAVPLIMSLCLATAHAQQVPSQVWNFRCPPANTTVEANNDIRINFRGAEPDNPLVCRSGTDFRRALGVWNMQISVFQSRIGDLAGLFPATTGRSVAINHFTTDADRNSVAMREVFRIVGFPKITVPAGQFQTVQIERFAEFTANNGGMYQRRDTIWLSTSDGVPVKATYDQVSGRSPGVRLVNWEATRIIRPAPRPPR